MFTQKTIYSWHKTYKLQHPSVGNVWFSCHKCNPVFSLRESHCTVQWDHRLQWDVQLAWHYWRRVWGSSGERFTQPHPVHRWEIHHKQPMWTHLSVQILWPIRLGNPLVTLNNCIHFGVLKYCQFKQMVVKVVESKHLHTFTGRLSAAGFSPISSSPCRSFCTLGTWWWLQLPSSSSPWLLSPPSWTHLSVFSP